MPSRWTVRVGTLLRIPIRVHLLLPAMAVVMVVTTPGYTGRTVFLSLLCFFAVMAVSTLAHELGHALVARGHRLEAHGITLWPLGGLTEVDDPRTARSKVRVALAGVSVNFLLGIIAGAAISVRDGAGPGLPNLRLSPDLLLTTWNLNMALGILNLLPGLPFDGGMAVEGLLWRRLGRPKARLVVLVTGAVVAAGLLMGGIANEDFMLVAVGGWSLSTVAGLYQDLRANGIAEEMLTGGYDLGEAASGMMTGDPPPEGSAWRRGKPEEKAERKAERDAARRAAADRAAAASSRDRLDGLLDRISAEGIGSLSEEERVFLNEESRRLRALRPGKSPTGR